MMLFHRSGLPIIFAFGPGTQMQEPNPVFHYFREFLLQTWGLHGAFNFFMWSYFPPLLTEKVKLKMFNTKCFCCWLPLKTLAFYADPSHCASVLGKFEDLEPTTALSEFSHSTPLWTGCMKKIVTKIWFFPQSCIQVKVPRHHSWQDIFWSIFPRNTLIFHPLRQFISSRICLLRSNPQVWTFFSFLPVFFGPSSGHTVIKRLGPPQRSWPPMSWEEDMGFQKLIRKSDFFWSTLQHFLILHAFLHRRGCC